MSLKRAAVLLFCVGCTLVLPAATTPEAYHQSYQTNYETSKSFSGFGGGDSSAAASISQPVVQTKTTFKGCSSATGCGGVTVENGQVVHKYGNPAAIGLEGAPENYDPAELHKKFALQASDINSAFSGGIPTNGPFWWASQDSPFKNAHETYMKWLKEGIAGTHFPSPCSACAAASGNAITGDKKVSAGGTFSNNIDISSNPFLNGQISSSYQGSSDFSKDSTGFSSQGASSVDISKNPFLNGNINVAHIPGQQSSSFESSYQTSSTGGTGLNLANNPFLNGAFSSTGSGGCGAGGCGTSSGSVHQSGSTHQSGSVTGGSLSSGSQFGGFTSSGSVSGGCAGKPGGCGASQQGGSVHQSGSVSGGSLSSGSQFGGFTSSGSVSGGCAGKPGGCGASQQGGSVHQSGSISGGSLSSGSQTGGFTSSGSASAGCAGRPGGCAPSVQGGSVHQTGSFQHTGSAQLGGSTTVQQQKPAGCDAASGGCNYQTQTQTTGFSQQSGCTGPFCGTQQQTQSFPSKPPTAPASNLPHPPGATTGGFVGESGSVTGQLTISCTGQGNICVKKHLCLNGYVNDNGENILQARSGVYCNTASEVCCKLKSKPGAGFVGDFQSTNGNKLDSASLQSSISSTITGPGLIHVPGTSGGSSNFASQTTTGFGQTGFAQNTGFGQTGFGSNRPANDVRPPYNSQQSDIYKGTTGSQSFDQTYTRPGASIAKPGIPYLPPEEPSTKPPPIRTTQRTTVYQPPPTQRTTVYQPPPTQRTTHYQPPPPTYQPSTPRPYVPPSPTPTPYRPIVTRPTYQPPKVTGPPYLPPKEDETQAPSYGSQQIIPGPRPEYEGTILLEDTRNPPIKVVPTIPNACAAALKCTSIEFCTADGIISNTSVVLTKEQAEFRVPLTDCKVAESGLVGKCCRDPTYTDPWPTNQLGQWVPDAFGDTGKYKADSRGNAPNRPTPIQRPNQNRIPNGFGPQPAGSINNPTFVYNPNVNPHQNQNNNNFPKNKPNNPTNTKNPINPQYPVGQIVSNVNRPNNPPPAYNQNFPKVPGNPNIPVNNQNPDNIHITGQIQLPTYGTAGTCGIRQQGIKPNGNRNKFEVDFAEIPWQAMVLLQTNRSLLCGGVITAPDAVVTSAHCVDGLQASNVLIKGGEWKLGIDEEPKPFQIVQVSKIIRHPGYQPGNLQNDLAILMLAENLRYAQNIGPICPRPAGQTDQILYGGKTQCIVTGWGKQVLQVNIPNSIMHSLDMTLVEPGQCQAQITQNYPHLLEQYNPNTCVCGQPSNPIASVCKVDIGSALACTNGNGVYYMEGVYSWDSGCTSSNQIASFYKFDAAWYDSAMGQSSKEIQQFVQNVHNSNGNVNHQISSNSNFQHQERVEGSYTQQNNVNYQQPSSQHNYRVQSNYENHASPSQSFSTQKGFQQVIGGHVHTGTQCPCVKNGKK